MSLNVRPLELLFFRVCCLLIILGLRPVKTHSVAPALLVRDIPDHHSSSLHSADVTDERSLAGHLLHSTMPLLDPAPPLGRIQKVVKNLRKIYDVPEVPPATPSMRLSFLHRIQDFQLQTEINHPHKSAHILSCPIIPLK